MPVSARAVVVAAPELPLAVLIPAAEARTLGTRTLGRAAVGGGGVAAGGVGGAAPDLTHGAARHLGQRHQLKVPHLLELRGGAAVALQAPDQTPSMAVIVHVLQFAALSCTPSFDEGRQEKKSDKRPD